MREERGRVQGNVVIYEPFELWGSVGGNVKVIEGGKLYIRGAVYGDIVAESGARVHNFGRITGKVVVHQGAKFINSGVIGGDAINKGGRLYVDHMGTVNGKVKAKRGDTVVEPGAKVLGA
jgi:cytoskeletal protein CcmA (bactofilin family)